MKPLSVCLLAAVLALCLGGCIRTEPDLREIKQIPPQAVYVTSLELAGVGGTFTDGNIAVSGNGYLVLDMQISGGSVKSVAVVDALADESVYTIRKPKTALYDSSFYLYQPDNQYKLKFEKAQGLHAAVAVYFVPEAV